MSETAKDLWRIAKELRGSEAAAWLTTIASVWIVLLASTAIARRVWGMVVTAWDWLRGKNQKWVSEDDTPEGA